MKEKIIYLDYLEQNYEKKIKYLIKDSELQSIDKIKAINYCQKLQVKCLTLYCKEYPEEFKILPKPPLVIYYYGNIKLLKTKKLAIIGSRDNTLYGQKALQIIINNIHGYTIVSGFAKGVDQLAHQGALTNDLPTIAILGGGFNHIYPKNNMKLLQQLQEKGLIISEYPPTVVPRPWHFLMRNRLIAALSEKVLVIEANVKSGSLTTVEVALDLSKEVYALPGSIFSKQSKGCNLLIEEGSNILSIDTKFIV
ncbi:MAG: DNA-processing protein DprA [Mycoplasmatales bacterium]